jgi:lysozyme
MNISRKGVRFIAEHEGFRARPYKAHPSEVYWTIGYGHYGPDVRSGMTWSQRHARRVLRSDLERVYVPAVRGMISRKLTQPEFDALVSFTYNLGTGALSESTLRRRLNDGDPKPKTFRQELVKWVNAGGQQLPGLVARRNDEIRLATEGKYR